MRFKKVSHLLQQVLLDLLVTDGTNWLMILLHWESFVRIFSHFCFCYFSVKYPLLLSTFHFDCVIHVSHTRLISTILISENCVRKIRLDRLTTVRLKWFRWRWRLHNCNWCWNQTCHFSCLIFHLARKVRFGPFLMQFFQ